MCNILPFWVTSLNTAKEYLHQVCSAEVVFIYLSILAFQFSSLCSDRDLVKVWLDREKQLGSGWSRSDCLTHQALLTRRHKKSRHLVENSCFVAPKMAGHCRQQFKSKNQSTESGAAMLFLLWEGTAVTMSGCPAVMTCVLSPLPSFYLLYICSLQPWWE